MFHTCSRLGPSRQKPTCLRDLEAREGRTRWRQSDSWSARKALFSRAEALLLGDSDHLRLPGWQRRSFGKDMQIYSEASVHCTCCRALNLKKCLASHFLNASRCARQCQGLVVNSSCQVLDWAQTMLCGILHLPKSDLASGVGRGFTDLLHAALVGMSFRCWNT